MLPSPRAAKAGASGVTSEVNAAQPHRTKATIAFQDSRLASQERFGALGRRFVGALGSRDWSLLQGLLARDVIWSFPGEARISGDARGGVAVVSRFKDIIASGVKIQLLNVMAGVNGVAFSTHNTATSDRGRVLDQYVVTVLAFEGDKVRQMDTYLSDPSKISLYFGPFEVATPKRNTSP